MTEKKRPQTQIVAQNNLVKKVIEAEHSNTVSKVIRNFPVVGIGASAGGLEALEQFFTNMPENSGMAFVVVQHLDPTHKSILPEIISRYTKMEVFQVNSGMEVKTNCIYIIPPNKDMALLHGNLHLIEPVAPRGLRLPIDFLFRSIALDQRDLGICIILSGTGMDGTLGIKAIKGEGGMVMAQDPENAKYDGMPRSAINTGLVDYVLPSNLIPERLISYVKKEFNKHKRTTPVPMPEPGEYLQKIFILLRDRTGHDFSEYKENTIIRRIERRMTINQIQSIEHYIRFLQQNPLEIDTLFKELLIGVTNFFRDEIVFASLMKNGLRQIVQGSEVNEPIRVWVPGCSTGEEAYTIAMLLEEQREALKRNNPIQIFATDIDPNAIEVARAGIYPENIAVDVPSNYLKKYFTKEKDTYQVRKTVRDKLVFAVQSLIKDPPFSKLNLISCRNLLIYMNSILQKKILQLFNYSLNNDGYLLLGTAESIGDATDYFSVIDKKNKIFKSKGQLLTGRPLMYYPTPITTDRTQPTKINVSPVNRQERSFRELAEQLLLSSFCPNCIIINETGDMLYVHGRMGKYLEATTGQPNLNILNLAREGIRIELSTAIRKVRKNNQEITYERLRIKINEDIQHIRLIVKPIHNPLAIKGLMAIIIEDLDKPNTVNDAPPFSDHENIQVYELEQELRSTKEYLRSTIEELETANEELKSTNEELQSSNEELQSTNEELETSKEELQSVNEELFTVNTEHQTKIEELTQANNDINNLMAATQIGTLFLDLDLCIMRFTPAITEFINLIQTDIGRPLSHIASNFKNEDLLTEVQEVVSTLIPKELEIFSEKGSWLLTRIMPYRTTENIIQGVVLTFVDITEQKQIEEQLIQSQTCLKDTLQNAEQLIKKRTADARAITLLKEKIFATIHLSIACLDINFNFIEVNDTFARGLGHSPSYFKKRNFFKTFPNCEYKSIFEHVIETGETHYLFGVGPIKASQPESEHTYWDWTITAIKHRNKKDRKLILSIIANQEKGLHKKD